MTTSRAELVAALSNIARDHRWSWDAGRRAVLDALPTAQPSLHPAAAVAALTDTDLDALLANDGLVAHVAELVTNGPATRAQVAYFSPEFGISELLAQYAGGLGVLAGDHLKASDDLGLSLCGVGLFYREGYFHQALDDTRQVERYERQNPNELGFDDTGAIVEVPLGEQQARSRVWRLRIGDVPLLALDTNLDANERPERRITDRLYGGDREHRLRQEMMLGVGGVRALRALRFSPQVFHLNEGHAGFLLLELLAEQTDAGASFEDAVEIVRPRVVFTTHTPVPAGIDRFDRELIAGYLAPWADRLRVPVERVLALGHHPADGSEDVAPFNMAALCLRLAGKTNGVSKLHGEVSRKLFAAVPGGDAIGSITNGVHARTWVAPRLQSRFDESLGKSWANGDESAWANVDALGNEELTDLRRLGREELVELVHERLGHTTLLDPEILTVGFARRFATYKRADLILRDASAIESLLADDGRPVQFVFAGKAHPADGPGKDNITRVAQFAADPASRGRFVFVPDYDIALARALYAGCDLWLNNPIRPQEACGTSGEKAALNGALNCSIRDGWWDELFDGRNGWEIPASRAKSPATRDRKESAAVHHLLASEIVPHFYDGDSRGPSPAWWTTVRYAWRTLGPRVVAARMLREYDSSLYGGVAASADDEA